MDKGESYPTYGEDSTAVVFNSRKVGETNDACTYGYTSRSLGYSRTAPPIDHQRVKSYSAWYLTYLRFVQRVDGSDI